MPTGTEISVEAKLLGACGAMKGQIKRLEALIKREKLNLDQLRRRLAEMEHQPKPDKEQFKALQKTIKDAEERLTSDDEGLDELKDEFRTNCGPLPN